MVRRHHRLSTVLVALAPLLLVVGCGPRYSDQDIADASQRLSRLYGLRNYERAVTEGQKWKDAPPRAFEPRAWYVLNSARNSSTEEQADSLVAWAETMVKEAPDNPWSWFALASALNYHNTRGKEAVAASDSMLRLASGMPFVLVRADVVRNQVSDTAGLAYLDSLPPEIRNSAVMLVRRGVVLDVFGSEAHSDSLWQASQDAFAQARKADSTNVEAYYLAGAYLSNRRNMDAAYPLLEEAAALTSALDVHSALWRAIQGRRDLTQEEKQALVKADGERLLEERGDLPSTLQSVAYIYKTLGLKDEATALEDRLLKESPNTEAAEWVLVDRYRAVAKDIYEAKQAGGEVDPLKQAEYRQMLQAYLDRPQHFNMRLLGDAYRSMFQLQQGFLKEDSVVDGDYLYSLVKGMIDYEGINTHIIYGASAVALADDSTHLEEAERIAREGIPKAKERIEGQKKYGIYETEGDFQKAVDSYTAIMYDALGWVFAAQGRMQMAEDTLLHAVELDPKNVSALNHLGRLFERKAGDDLNSPALDSAQDFFIRGAMVQQPGENPNDGALKKLYERRHGGMEGWDAFRARIEDIDRARRRKEILAGRKAEPEPVVDFSLTSLTGKHMDSRSMRGKVVVVNFWGTWCGPCVAEMPEFQKFHEKYRNDPGVVVLTVDNDPNPEDVRTWMKKHKYDFPVLLDDGYVARAGVQGFPTTWFIDGKGRVGFSKMGWSESLVEEFGWRVEALRSGA